MVTIALIVLLGICLTLIFVIQVTKIIGASMLPVLKDKDLVLVNKLAYKLRKPRRFEVIAFRFNQEKKQYLVKRIIALPNEKLQIKKGHIYINGVKLDEEYGLEQVKSKQGILKGGIATKEMRLANDEYFVLGDNRSNSLDSRSAEIGAVKFDRVVGVVWFRMVWPGRN